MQDTQNAAVALLDRPAGEVEIVSAPARTEGRGRPEPDWVRGHCPECGDALVSNLYYIGGHGYVCAYECWNSLGESASCTYRRVL